MKTFNMAQIAYAAWTYYESENPLDFITPLGGKAEPGDELLAYFPDNSWVRLKKLSTTGHLSMECTGDNIHELRAMQGAHGKWLFILCVKSYSTQSWKHVVSSKFYDSEAEAREAAESHYEYSYLPDDSRFILTEQIG